MNEERHPKAVAKLHCSGYRWSDAGPASTTVWAVTRAISFGDDAMNAARNPTAVAKLQCLGPCLTDASLFARGQRTAMVTLRNRASRIWQIGTRRARSSDGTLEGRPARVLVTLTVVLKMFLAVLCSLGHDCSQPRPKFTDRKKRKKKGHRRIGPRRISLNVRAAGPLGGFGGIFAYALRHPRIDWKKSWSKSRRQEKRLSTIKHIKQDKPRRGQNQQRMTEQQGNRTLANRSSDNSLRNESECRPEGFGGGPESSEDIDSPTGLAAPPIQLENTSNMRPTISGTSDLVDEIEAVKSMISQEGLPATVIHLFTRVDQTFWGGHISGDNETEICSGYGSDVKLSHLRKCIQPGQPSNTSGWLPITLLDFSIGVILQAKGVIQIGR